MRTHYLYIPLLLIVALVLGCCHEEKVAAKKILVLHTYTEGQSYWQKELIRGLEEGFADQHIPVEMEHCYLDFEQLQTMTNMMKKIGEIYNEHSGDRRPDLIMVTYEPAFFSFIHLYINFPERYDFTLPVVYCGTHYRTNKLEQVPNFVGVNSAPAYETNFRMGLKLFPDISLFRIFNCGDSMKMITGFFTSKMDSTLLAMVDTVYLENNTPVKVLRNARVSTSVDHTPYIGTIPLWNGVYSRMAQNSDYPYLLVHSVGLGDGFLGGYIASSYDETYHAAQMAGRILRGTPLEEINIEDTPKRYIFDWKVMQKFGIDESQLPTGSEIIQMPFHVKYAAEIYIGGGVMLCFLLLAISLYRKQLVTKKRVQADLQASEVNMRTILTSINEGVISVDKQFNIFEISDRALKLLQLEGPPDKYMHLPLVALMNITSAKSGSALQGILEDLRDAGHEGWQEYDAIIHCLVNNRHLHVFSEISPILQDDQFTGAVITFHDITARLQQKEYVNLIARNSNVLIWQYNPRNESVISNQLLSGSPTRHGDNLYVYMLEEARQLIHPDDLPSWLKNIQELRKNPNRIATLQIRLLGKDSNYHWWRCRVAPLNNTTADTTPFLGVSINIETYKSLETELKVGRQKAEQSDHLKSAFLANMSHEIRTPLNAIVGFANLLCHDRDKLEQEEIVQFVEIIQNNSDLLLRLIADIVDMSCIESNTVTFTYADCSLNDLMEEIAATQQVIFPGHLNLVTDVPPVSLHIYIDKQRLIQVITNLINNAVKFTEKGSITFGYKDLNAREVVFFVEDTGKGISPEDCEKIFDRYFKKYNHVQGSGLGLSICQMIVEQFGGSIAVQSQLGKGSRFEVRIPKNKCK